MPSSANYSQDKTQSGYINLDGYGPIDPATLATPYKPYQGYDMNAGQLTSQLDDPQDVLAQARAAVAENSPPIPSWETVYQTAVQMRQERLQQELAAMDRQGTEVQGRVHDLVGTPLPTTLPGGPLGPHSLNSRVVTDTTYDDAGPFTCVTATVANAMSFGGYPSAVISTR